MHDFFRFPHTPHIAWLGTGVPRDDKVLSQKEIEALLSELVVVEEKLDGANLGISVGRDGEIRIQNRGQYLAEPYTGQFARLGSWLGQYRAVFDEKLLSHLILFGEWCAAKHSLAYEALPDWFVAFDIFDRHEQRFWSSGRRNALTVSLGLATAPQLFKGKTTLSELRELLDNSNSYYRAGPPEGVVIRQDVGDWCQARAKLVRAEFTQTISEHWRSRSIEWNRVAPAGSHE